MKKTNIPSLSYNAMFKAVFSNNKGILSKLIEAILSYCKIDIDVQDKELIIRNSELPLESYQDRQLICDFIIKLNEHIDLNIEVNKSYYPGLTERNLTYSFKIYYEHFKTGDDYKEFNKYNLLQVNFNNFPNPNGKNINKFFMMDIEDLTNTLSKNLCILNIDIASCFELVYNKTNLKEVSLLERFSGILYASNIEDISNILGSDMLTKKEKKEFLDDVLEKSKDKDVLKAIKLENSIDYRFALVEEEALNRGIEQGISQGIEQGISQGFEQGIEQEKESVIKSMLQKNMNIEDIHDITGKSIVEIKKLEKSMK